MFDTFPKRSILFQFRRRVSEILQMLTTGLIISKRTKMGTWLSTCIELMLKLAILIIIIKNILFILSIPQNFFFNFWSFFLIESWKHTNIKVIRSVEMLRTFGLRTRFCGHFFATNVVDRTSIYRYKWNQSPLRH